jgi:hypothetical protein
MLIFSHECGCVQLQVAGDAQAAQDAAAVHGDDKDKAPAKSAPLCGFRVLLSTLGSVKGNGSQWYKLAAVRPTILHCDCNPLICRDPVSDGTCHVCRCCQPGDIVESGAVVTTSGDSETSHGKVLIKAEQNWNKQSMRSRLFGVLNG